MTIRYSEQAIKDLKAFNPAERVLIAQKIEYLSANLDILKRGKKVRELKGTRYEAQYRYTIARKIRAIFRIEGEEIILLVLRIGRRKEVYE
ncbi:MAG: type II toxin-antitoxin system RelE/ParE family toxin [Campylobacterales bacterium]|nr:type II toxin-antitoxin system RelE/ParE family toxin [Campylobacterales bacterium]